MPFYRHFPAALFATLLAANTCLPASPTLNPKESSPSDRQYRMPQDQVEARKLVDTLATSIEDLTRLLLEAKASNDKKRMRAALDAGIAHLAYMKVSADKCKQKMAGMENHKGMGTGKGMKAPAPADSSRNEAPAGDAHQGH